MFVLFVFVCSVCITFNAFILYFRNFYSDLLEMLTLVIEMEKINRTVKSNGKRVLEVCRLFSVFR